MSTWAQPGMWNLMAMPLGLEGAPSGTDGRPPSLEKRTITGMLLPSKNTARLRRTSMSGNAGRPVAPGEMPVVAESGETKS